jgi:hypothetical protein
MQVMDCRRTQVAYCVFVFLNMVFSTDPKHRCKPWHQYPYTELMTPVKRGSLHLVQGPYFIRWIFCHATDYLVCRQVVDSAVITRFQFAVSKGPYIVV